MISLTALGSSRSSGWYVPTRLRSLRISRPTGVFRILDHHVADVLPDHHFHHPDRRALHADLDGDDIGIHAVFHRRVALLPAAPSSNRASSRSKRDSLLAGEKRLPRLNVAPRVALSASAAIDCRSHRAPVRRERTRSSIPKVEFDILSIEAGGLEPLMGQLEKLVENQLICRRRVAAAPCELGVDTMTGSGQKIAARPSSKGMCSAMSP